MPYKDPEKRKEYARQYGRLRRAGLPPKQASNLGPLRIRTASDVLALLESTLNLVQAENADTFAKARVIGYLASISLRAVETAELEARVAALEETLRKKGVSNDSGRAN